MRGLPHRHSVTATKARPRTRRPRAAPEGEAEERPKPLAMTSELWSYEPAHQAPPR